MGLLVLLDANCRECRSWPYADIRTRRHDIRYLARVRAVSPGRNRPTRLVGCSRSSCTFGSASDHLTGDRKRKVMFPYQSLYPLRTLQGPKPHHQSHQTRQSPIACLRRLLWSIQHVALRLLPVRRLSGHRATSFWHRVKKQLRSHANLQFDKQ